MGSKQKLIEKLITFCSEEIANNHINISGTNKARSPIVFVYMGDETIENYAIIKDIIDNNWRLNSNHIYNLGIRYTDADYSITNLETGETIKNIDEKALLDDIFSLALSAPIGTFTDTNVVKVKFVISCLDEHFKELIKVSGNIETSLTGLSVFKDLYLLIHQGGTFKERNCTDECISYLFDLEKMNENKFKQVFVLSNRMKNGAILDPFNIRSNYRLIANSVLLIDNDTEDYQSRKEVFYTQDGYLRTMSYRIVQKPCKEIVVVMLKSFLNALIDIESKPKEIIEKMFSEELFKENYFETNFERHFPNTEDFKYLPYKPDGLKKLMAVYKNCKKYDKYSINEDILNTETFGCFYNFYQKNYVDKIILAFEKEDFKDKLFDNAAQKYTYRDIIEHFKFTDVIDIACQQQPIIVDRQHAKSFFSVIERQCYLNSKNMYFELMKEPYHETMLELWTAANRFEKILVELRNDIASTCVIEDEGIYQSIEKYYSDYMENYFKTNLKDILKQFTIKISTYEDMIEELTKMFVLVLSKDRDKKLTCGFTEELSNRLGIAATPANKEKLIKDALVPRIDEYTRLNVASDNIREIYDYYFCNNNPEFLKIINVDSFFNTNDENCFEHLKIYRFNSIRDVLGGKLEA